MGDQHYRDASAGHGGEDAGGHADHAFHPRPGNVEHRHVVEVRDAFNRQIVLVAAGADERSRRLRVASIFNQTWDLELGDRGDGARVQHFRAKIGELHRLLIRHRFQQTRIRHLARVASVHSVDIGPDFAAIGAQAGGQHRSRIVGAVAPQHHQLPLLIASGKPGHQDHMVCRDLAGGDAAGGFGDIDRGLHVVTNGKQFFHRVNDTDFMTTGFQQTRHDGDGELFASADQRGIDAIRALTQQANTVQDMLNLSKLLLNKGFQLGERESGLGVGKALKKFGKNAFSVGNIGEGILAANGLFNHRYQMVSDLRRGRQDGRYLPLPGITLQNIGNPQKPFRICH